MKAALKAEFRKLFSVRSTYIITGLVAIIVIVVAGIFEGYNLNVKSLADPTQLAGDVTGALNVTIFGAIVAILLITHEYRYNTIMYTLTSVNKRSKVLVAKFVVITCYALFLAAFIGILSPIMSYLGVHIHGHSFGPQTLHYWDLAWRSLFYGWGYAMAGFILAFIARNQVGAVVSLFVIPSVVENLLGFLLLKHNSVYMPFSALSQVINGPGGGTPISSSMSSEHAALIYTGYVVVGLAVACVLFLKRDAN
jgi:ABC-type transport system involved in multi-copper enzyme maturation permease subunit